MQSPDSKSILTGPRGFQKSNMHMSQALWRGTATVVAYFKDWTFLTCTYMFSYQVIYAKYKNWPL